MEEKNARARIIESYNELLRKYKYNKISVTKIVEKANVNKSTFYRNFADVYDLYDAVCLETADSIIDYAVRTMNVDWEDVDVQGFIELFNNVLQATSDKMYLLSGVNGSLRFVTILRERIIKFANKNVLPAVERLFGDSSIIGVLVDAAMLYGFLSIDPNMYSDYKFKGFLGKIDLKKHIFDTFAADVDLLSDNSGDFDYKLVKATYSIWCNKKTSMFNVNELMRQAGISRTEFYTHYKNLLEFYGTIEKAAARTLTRYTLSLTFNDETVIGQRFYDKNEHFDKHFELVKNIPHLTLFAFIFKTVSAGRNIYLDFIRRAMGDEVVEKNLPVLLFYYSAMFIIGWQFLVTGDFERFDSHLRAYYRFAENYCDEHGIPLNECKKKIRDEIAG